MKKILRISFAVLCLTILLLAVSAPGVEETPAAAQSPAASIPVPPIVLRLAKQTDTCNDASILYLSHPAKCMTREGLKTVEQTNPGAPAIFPQK